MTRGTDLAFTCMWMYGVAGAYTSAQYYSDNKKYNSYKTAIESYKDKNEAALYYGSVMYASKNNPPWTQLYTFFAWPLITKTKIS